MPFDPTSDTIALTIPKFTLLKNSDGFLQKYNEPYIVSVAIDESGTANPAIDFNFMQFPKVAKGGTVTMLGDGHIIYGPKQPGQFVAVSILVMESDRDIRDLGQKLETIVQSKAIELGIGLVTAANPGAAGVLGALKELTVLISGFLKENKDDELFRTEGTFLRDHPVPYHINRSYERENDYIRLSLNVLPLQAANGEGPAPKAISIA